MLENLVSFFESIKCSEFYHYMFFIGEQLGLSSGLVYLLLCGGVVYIATQVVNKAVKFLMSLLLVYVLFAILVEYVPYFRGILNIL